MVESSQPLADRLRPRAIKDIIGQTHLLGPDSAFRKVIESDRLPSMILWGPPGCGKTTLARLIANTHPFYQMSAVLSGIQDLRSIVAEIAKDDRRGAVLFIDEIHRWNKAQQDALLPYVENGTVTLIGATTENPSFEIISPLLSRARVFVLKPLTPEQIKTLIQRALNTPALGLGGRDIRADDEAIEALARMADGDGRRALNMLDMAAHSDGHITLASLATAFEKKWIKYDKAGDAHYDTISAFIKSMRGSDPDAAVYYLARMYESGEDPRFIARRMIIFASEDIGNADPRALQIAVAAAEAFDRVGKAEGWIPLSQAVVYLACAPKSNAAYMAYHAAKADIEAHGDLPPPLHLRNAPTALMKHLGYHKGYQYAHDRPDARVSHGHLPEKLIGRRYYEPTRRGLEEKISQFLSKHRTSAEK